MEELSSRDRERLWQAFLAGFMTSAEGWNAEYPYCFGCPNGAPEERKRKVMAQLEEDFDSFLAESR